jgi:hypothetical protein
VHHYYRTTEANRVAFWHAIHALRGASRLRPDAAIKVEDS